MVFKSKSGVMNIWIKPNGKYLISHKIKGKPHYYGTYETLEDAVKAKEHYVKNNWKKEKNPMRYISKINSSTAKKKWYIQRCSKEITGYFGSFDTLEEAKYERDLLESVDWDLDMLCDGIDERIGGKTIFNNRVIE